MKRKSTFIIAALACAVALASCSTKADTDKKNDPGTDKKNDDTNKLSWYSDEELIGYGAFGLYLPEDTLIRERNGGSVKLSGMKQDGYNSYVSETYNTLKRSTPDIYSVSKTEKDKFERVKDDTAFDQSNNSFFYKRNNTLYQAELLYDATGTDPFTTLNFRDVTDQYRNYTYPEL